MGTTDPWHGRLHASPLNATRTSRFVTTILGSNCLNETELTFGFATAVRRAVRTRRISHVYARNMRYVTAIAMCEDADARVRQRRTDSKFCAHRR